MDKQLHEIESLCLNAIKKGEPEAVEIYFGPYLSYSPKTPHTGFIKAYMLLYYFSLDNKKAFYLTLETVTPEELEDENIVLVMRVERYVNIGAVEKLKKVIGENTRKELGTLLEDIFAHQRKSVELHSAGEGDVINRSNDEKNIKDAIFIGNSVANF